MPSGNALASAELRPGDRWTDTGGATPHAQSHGVVAQRHGACCRELTTLSRDAELYDRRRHMDGHRQLNTARYGHRRRCCPTAKVLAGGYQPQRRRRPRAWGTTRRPAHGRTPAAKHRTLWSHTATLLPDRSPVAGSSLVSAELYDPATGTWTDTSSLNTHAVPTRRPATRRQGACRRRSAALPRERGTLRPATGTLGGHRQHATTLWSHGDIAPPTKGARRRRLYNDTSGWLASANSCSDEGGPSPSVLRRQWRDKYGISPGAGRPQPTSTFTACCADRQRTMVPILIPPATLAALVQKSGV